MECMCVFVLLKIMKGRERWCKYSYSKRADKIDIEYTTPPSPLLSLSSSSTPSSCPLSPYFCSLTFHSTWFHSTLFRSIPFLVFMISTSTSGIIHAILHSSLLSFSFLPILESAGYSLKYTTHSFLPSPFFIPLSLFPSYLTSSQLHLIHIIWSHTYLTFKICNTFI